MSIIEVRLLLTGIFGTIARTCASPSDISDPTLEKSVIAREAERSWPIGTVKV